MCDPKYSKSTWTAMGVGVSVHLTAIGPLIMFSTILILMIQDRSGGDFPIHATTGTLIMGVLNLLGAMFSILAFKYFGRRQNLLIGYSILAFIFIMMGIFLKVEAYTALYVMILLFVFVFQIFVGTMSFLYAAEVCADTAQGLALAALFFTIVVLTGSMQYLIDSPIGLSGPFFFYSGLNVVCLMYSYLCVKETKGLNPLELKMLYWSDALKKKHSDE